MVDKRIKEYIFRSKTKEELSAKMLEYFKKHTIPKSNIKPQTTTKNEALKIFDGEIVDKSMLL